VLFDERPKDNRRDLFDREKELDQLKSNIDRPLLLVTGIRRIGKTSLLKVCLNELNVPYILIDARELRQNYGISDLYTLFAKALSSNLEKLRQTLSRIKRVKILGNEVELAWKGKRYISLSELFDELNEGPLVIAIDEAQNLRGPNSSEIKNAIAHSYDYNKNLTFVLTGSEVGLLYDFLGVEEPSSPLYGRYHYTVHLERFDRKASLEFLKRGFEEAGAQIESGVIEQGVDAFDGIVGWLAFFGNSVLKGHQDINEIKNTAVSMAKNELLTLCSKRSPRYIHALKCLSQGKSTWSILKKCIESKEGATLSTSVLDSVLRGLERMSVIKGYEFLDPVYKEASAKL
jgi:AAA+ ATPase superfamily predicted ATPase